MTATTKTTTIVRGLVEAGCGLLFIASLIALVVVEIITATKRDPCSSTAVTLASAFLSPAATGSINNHSSDPELLLNADWLLSLRVKFPAGCTGDKIALEASVVYDDRDGGQQQQIAEARLSPFYANSEDPTFNLRLHSTMDDQGVGSSMENEIVASGWADVGVQLTLRPENHRKEKDQGRERSSIRLACLPVQVVSQAGSTTAGALTVGNLDVSVANVFCKKIK